MTSPPPVVVLHLWGVRPRAVPAAVVRMGLDRARIRPRASTTRAAPTQAAPTQAAPTPGGADRPLFAKLLGTGDGRTFTARDADPLHWGLLTVWPDTAAAARFETGAVIGGWGRIARETLRVQLTPITSRGRWSGREPFGDPVPTRHEGPVASITRARLHPRRARSFWRAVPPVSADLHQVPGLALAVGIGEAPVGLQGTFSLWRDSAALTQFARGSAAHLDAVRRTPIEGWYAEELFARFAVDDVSGSFDGLTPLA